MKRNTLESIVSNYTIDVNGCWLHGTAAHIKDGYCRVRILENGKSFKRLAHRLSYVHHNGPIPDDIDVLHKCDVRNCINPEHLFVGTHQDNMIDMHRKGRRNMFGTNNPNYRHGRNCK